MAKKRWNKLLPEVKIDTPLRNIAGACADFVRCTKAGARRQSGEAAPDSTSWREGFYFCGMFQRDGYGWLLLRDTGSVRRDRSDSIVNRHGNVISLRTTKGF